MSQQYDPSDAREDIADWAAAPPQEEVEDAALSTTAPDVPVAGGGPVGGTVTTSVPVGTESKPSTGSTTDTVREQSKQVGEQAVDSGKQVASVAKDQAQSVLSEAGTQARNLVHEAQTQLTSQASTQQSNLASWLKSLAGDLHDMVDGSPRAGFSDESRGERLAGGLARETVRQVATRAGDVAQWLDNHEPADVLDEVSRFARRRPGLFLALAAAAGVVTGRLTRGLTASSDTSSQQSSATPVSTSSAQFSDVDVVAPPGPASATETVVFPEEPDMWPVQRPSTGTGQ